MMKASALLGAGWEDDSLDVLWRDASRAFCKLKRKDAASEIHAFIPIPSGAERPNIESVNRLIHEYELREHLDPTWALRPVDLARERGQPMLVVDYAGGAPLDRLVQQPMEIGQFLRLAIALSGVLGGLHGCGLIHRDLKPANVLVDSDTGIVRLTGFGISSRLPRERQSPEPPRVYCGNARVYGARADRTSESFDRFPQRPLLTRSHILRDADWQPSIYGVRSDGMGALPHRSTTGGARRAPEPCASSGVGDDDEAARKDGGGALSDRGGR